MKRTLSLLAGLALAAAAIGGDGLSQLSITMSTQGPDRYADGTAVAAGETYLLVYVNEGATFGGVCTDGTLVDAANNRIVTTSQATAASKCAFKAIQYAAADFPVGGTWVIVLLDTRTAGGAPGGLVAAHSPANAQSSASSRDLALGTLSAPAANGTGLSAGSETASPAGTPAPVITAVRTQSGSVEVKFSNFTDGALYEVHASTNIAAGAWVTAAGGQRVQARDLGVTPGPGAELPVTVTVPANDTVRFFKVIAK
jgi:hypothetical protein